MAGGGEWEQQERCRESKANRNWFHEGGNKAAPATKQCWEGRSIQVRDNILLRILDPI